MKTEEFKQKIKSPEECYRDAHRDAQFSGGKADKHDIIAMEMYASQFTKGSTEELIIKVTQWAKDRNIIDGCPPIKQAYKTLEECGELIEAVTKNEYGSYGSVNYINNIKDAIGDITVTLIIQCAMQGFDFVECLESAFNEIKDRKGKLIDGKFVKEA